MGGCSAYTEHKGQIEMFAMMRLAWTIRPSVVQLWNLMCSAAVLQGAGSAMKMSSDRWRGWDVSPSLKGMELRLIWVKGEGVAPQ